MIRSQPRPLAAACKIEIFHENFKPARNGFFQFYTNSNEFLRYDGANELRFPLEIP